jgi:nicotinate phosphoribosyltransferase
MMKPVDFKAEAAKRDRSDYVRARTDKYFSKSREIIEAFGDRQVTYGVFMRRGVICSVNPALELLRDLYPEQASPLKITRQYEEGAFVPDQKPMFAYSGSFAALVELETLILRRVGVACVSAYNAFKMATDMPKVSFIDMHARHSSGDDMSELAAYGASVGSRIAKLSGAIGFVASSQDLTAHYYGQEKGIGTMPHAIVGYAGSTLKAAQMYAETHPDDNLTVLVDYYAREFSDAIDVCRWWYHDYLPRDPRSARTLSFRLDTHGERYAESLNYESSVELVANWLHVLNEYEAVRAVMGEEAYDADTFNIVKDRVRRVLFGTGVSVASVIKLRQTLDAAGFNAARIVASSGFNPFKCKMFGKARAPVDVIGTGSFIPDAYSDTIATADIFMYDSEFRIKVGREKLFQGLKG